MKTCNVCNKEKTFDFFYLRKSNKDGYTNRCIECTKEYNKNYGIINREIISEKNKIKREKNFEYRKKYHLNYRIKNTEKLKQYYKEYFKKNKDIILHKTKIKLQTDNLFRLSHNLRCLIGVALKNKGVKKQSKTKDILGCSFEEFKQHLENQFEPWMNWDNYGLYNGTPNYGWDIDHIIPSSSAITEEDVIKLNHHSNLKPLCSYYNRDVKKHHTNLG